MVDFTQPVNNEDMVEGLNQLIHRNMDLLNYLDKELIPIIEDYTYRMGLQQLKDLHEQHAHLLGDTVRFLGGAPDYHTNQHGWIHKTQIEWAKVRRDTKMLQAMASEEQELQQEYLQTIAKLKASPETVSAIDQALGERESTLRWLHHAARGDT